MKCKECDRIKGVRGNGLCSVHYARWYRKTNPEVAHNYLNNKFYDGKKDIVLERDNWECQECGMTQEEHFTLFNRSLAIHHKDGKGYNSKEKNNDLDNLMTICVRCHAMIDGVQFVKGSNVNPKTGKGGRKKGTPNKPKKGSTNK